MPYKVREHFPIDEVTEVEACDPDILAGTHEICYGGMPEERFAYKSMKPAAFQEAFSNSPEMVALRENFKNVPGTPVTAIEGIDLEEVK